MQLILESGIHVEIRPVRPSDKDEFVRSFELLSEKSRYLRFFTAKARLSERELAYLTEVDGESHVALVALETCTPSRGIGVARFVRLTDEPDVAEPAIVVIDEMQGMGVGRALLTALSEAAQAHGVRAFRADVLVENTAVRGLFAELGATSRASSEPDAVTYELPVVSARASADNPFGRILAAAASGSLVFERGLAHLRLVSATLKGRGTDGEDEDEEEKDEKET